MFNFPYVDILTWAYIFFKKLRPETGGEFEKHPLHYFILLYGGVNPAAILSKFRYLPILASFGVKITL